MAVFVGTSILMAMSGKSYKESLIRATPKNFYDLKAAAINEVDTLHMSDYKGKMVLIVNVASECGYTYQYEGLQKLQESYGDKLQVIGFPCNQFGGQEPGSNEDVLQFCKQNYGVTFPMASKVDVKGEKQHPLYTWLTSKELNGKDDHNILWNFNKFLISADGELVAYFSHKVKPMSEEILQYLP